MSRLLCPPRTCLQGTAAVCETMVWGGARRALCASRRWEGLGAGHRAADQKGGALAATTYALRLIPAHRRSSPWTALVKDWGVGPVTTIPCSRMTWGRKDLHWRRLLGCHVTIAAVRSGLLGRYAIHRRLAYQNKNRLSRIVLLVGSFGAAQAAVERNPVYGSWG